MAFEILLKINSFIKNRLIEFFGIFLALVGIFLLISLATYSPGDPNFIYTPGSINIENWGGFYGSVISDFFLQSIGLVSFLVIINFLNWGLTITSDKKIHNSTTKIFFTMAYVVFGTTFFNIFYNDSYWLIDNGNGGFVGRIIKENLYMFNNIIENQYVVAILLFLSITFFILSINFKMQFVRKILTLPYLLSIKILYLLRRKKSEDKIVENSSINFDSKNPAENKI